MLTAAKLVLAALIFFLATCGGPPPRQNSDIIDAPPADAPCITTMSGKVFAPNGTLPLYNVVVYIPASTPGPLHEGVECAQCSDMLPGGVVTSTISDAEGKFVLNNVPPGDNVPVVITTGKWRRQLTVPFVGQCVDTIIQDGEFRLPKDRTEGDIPRIAMVTGSCDPLACIFTKMGVSPSEFGLSSSGPERIVWYNANDSSSTTSPGVAEPAQTALWNNLAELSKFDMVINACECSKYTDEKTGSADAVRQYTDMGGRFFGSHYQYTWMKEVVPQWQSTAPYHESVLHSNKLVTIDTTEAGGDALSKWLVAVGGSTTPGQLVLSTSPQLSEDTVNPPTTRWLYNGDGVHYLSFKTPVGVESAMQCGKVVHAGIHVSEGQTLGASFPNGCDAATTPDEKALIFMMFDLGACVDVIQ